MQGSASVTVGVIATPESGPTDPPPSDDGTAESSADGSSSGSSLGLVGLGFLLFMAIRRHMR